MGLFDFVSGWREKLIDRPLDAKMAETLKIGLEVARANAHVISGKMRDSIGGEYNRSTKTIMLHFDASYSLIELTRGPTKNYQTHDFATPACKAMGDVWGGSFEIHIPHASIGRDSMGLARMRQQEVRLHHALGGGRGGLGSRTRIHSRRWHKWNAEVPADATMPVL